MKKYSYFIYLRNKITLTYGGGINRRLDLLKLSNSFKSFEHKTQSSFSFPKDTKISCKMFLRSFEITKLKWQQTASRYGIVK